METGNIITISVGTLSIVSFLGFLGKFTIEKYFSFKEKNYENKLDIKVKEFETKLSQVLPERITTIKRIYQLLIELERQVASFVNQQGDEKLLLDSYNLMKKEFYLNEFYFNTTQREIIKNILNILFSCYCKMDTFHRYGETEYLSIDEKREKFKFSRDAQDALYKALPKIKEELIHEIQEYYQII
jgi:hypothetical protein